MIVSLVYAAALSWLLLTPVEGGYVGLLLDPAKQTDVLVPIDCSRARGTVHRDYVRMTYQKTARTDETYCMYALSSFRASFPEYESIDDDDLVSMLYNQVGLPPKKIPTFFDAILFRLIVRLPVSIPMLVIGMVLIRAWVRAVRTYRSAA